VLFVGEISLPRSRTVLLGAWIETADNPSGQRTSLIEIGSLHCDPCYSRMSPSAEAFRQGSQVAAAALSLPRV